MKIKLDENLPHRLAAILKDLGHQVDTAFEERLIGRPDTEIWRAAQDESKFLITRTSISQTRGRSRPAHTTVSCLCVSERQAARD